MMDHLGPQFFDHLAELEERTGMEYSPGGLVLPNGQRVSALHTLYMPSSDLHGPSVSSLIPTETGAIHALEATLKGGQHPIHGDVPAAHLQLIPEEGYVSGLTAASGRPGTAGRASPQWYTAYPWGAMTASSGAEFGDQVSRAIEDAVPHERRRENNFYVIGKTAEATRNGRLVAEWKSGKIHDLQDR